MHRAFKRTKTGHITRIRRTLIGLKSTILFLVRDAALAVFTGTSSADNAEARRVLRDLLVFADAESLLLLLLFKYGNRNNSQSLHSIKSPWLRFTLVLFTFPGQAPSGRPSQRGIVNSG